MIPRARRTTRLQPLPQPSPHLQDPPTHRTQIILPLLKQNRIIQHTTRDASAVCGRVRNLRPLQDSQLGGNVSGSNRCVWAWSGDEVESACSFAVEAEVLCEGLRDAQLEALLDEVADGPGVADEIAGCEALVGGVEEGEVRAGAHDFCDLLPLILGWVDAGGVVGAGVEQDYGAGGRCLQRAEHAVEVKALGLGGEVGVLG